MSRFRPFFAVSLLVFFAGLSACRPSPPGHELWTAADVRESIRRGHQLCEKLEQHREQTGSYPTSLSDLATAADLASLSPVVGNREWQYKPYLSPGDSKPRFSLSVRNIANGGPEKLYLTWDTRRDDPRPYHFFHKLP